MTFEKKKRRSQIKLSQFYSAHTNTFIETSDNFLLSLSGLQNRHHRPESAVAYHVSHSLQASSLLGQPRKRACSQATWATQTILHVIGQVSYFIFAFWLKPFSETILTTKRLRTAQKTRELVRITLRSFFSIFYPSLSHEIHANLDHVSRSARAFRQGSSLIKIRSRNIYFTFMLLDNELGPPVNVFT